jgi:tripartite-type tricarboxylate transporter receptor subunit TctC
MKNDCIVILFACAALQTVTCSAAAPSADLYPNRPVRLMVPYPPGGGTDTFSRIFARALTEHVGQPIVVDNRSGGGTIVGTVTVAHAAPDGYTLLMNAAAFVINPLLHAKPPYDAVRDFTPIMQIASAPNLLVVNPALPARSLRELIELAKAKPGAINFASTGIGTPAHLSGELLATMAGIKITHVPYRGGASVIPDLISGQVQMSFVSLPAALPHVKAGRIRALGNPSAKRSDALPDVPTIAEAGLPGYDASNWQGVFAPAKTPARIIDRLNSEFRWALSQADVLKQLAVNGYEPIGSTPAEFVKIIQVENVKWGKVISTSGARAE